MRNNDIVSATVMMSSLSWFSSMGKLSHKATKSLVWKKAVRVSQSHLVNLHNSKYQLMKGDPGAQVKAVVHVFQEPRLGDVVDDDGDEN